MISGDGLLEAWACMIVMLVLGPQGLLGAAALSCLQSAFNWLLGSKAMPGGWSVARVSGGCRMALLMGVETGMGMEAGTETGIGGAGAGAGMGTGTGSGGL